MVGGNGCIGEIVGGDRCIGETVGGNGSGIEEIVGGNRCIGEIGGDGSGIGEIVGGDRYVGEVGGDGSGNGCIGEEIGCNKLESSGELPSRYRPLSMSAKMYSTNIDYSNYPNLHTIA